MRQRPLRLLRPATLIDRWKAWLRTDVRSDISGPAGERQVFVDEYALACIASVGVCPWAPYIDMMRDESLSSPGGHSAPATGRTGDRMATS